MSKIQVSQLEIITFQCWSFFTVKKPCLDCLISENKPGLICRVL